ncbi:MAG: hypothetical protein WA982_00690 [Rubrobacteraceae bacterium]
MGKLLKAVLFGAGGIALVWAVMRSEAVKEFTDVGVALVMEVPSHYKAGPDEFLKV